MKAENVIRIMGSGIVRGFLMGIGASRDETEDMEQEVALRLLEKAPDEINNRYVWLVCRSVYMDWVRGLGAFSRDSEERPLIGKIGSGFPNPEEVLVYKEALSRIERCVSEMKKGGWGVNPHVDLDRLFERIAENGNDGTSVYGSGEIASELGIGKSMVSRYKNKLKELYFVQSSVKKPRSADIALG
jgi:hypothetical protein